MISVKHCGSCDILYLGHKGILAAAALGGIYLVTTPVTVLFTLVVIRWSPVMMPFHIFGGHEKLVELESLGSTWFWGVFAIDAAVLTAGVIGVCGPAAIVCDAFCKMKLITRTMR